jgi:catechol 2,3-dioxygenase-like lactoylglutathione lyase family enzyme
MTSPMRRAGTLLTGILAVLVVAGGARTAASAPQASGEAALPRARFHHVHINSLDPEAHVGFYTARFQSKRGPGGIWVGDLNLHVAGTTSAIAPAAAKGAKTFASPRGRVLDHFAFAVPDLDRPLAQLKVEGVTVLQPPTTILGGTLQSAFVMAPDNVELELVQEMSR